MGLNINCVSAATIVYEAESAVTTGADPFVSVAEGSAAGGQYLWVPPGSADQSSTATYTLSAPSTGAYTLYLRYIAPNGGDDSFFLPTTTADGSGNFINTSEKINGLAVGTSGAYQWININTNIVLNGISTSDPNALGTYGLTAGSFDFRIRNREDGLKLDVFVFDTDDSLTILELDAIVGVPEPSSMSFLLLTAMGLTMRRNRS